MNYYIWQDEEQKGPFTRDELAAMFTRGEIFDGSLSCTEDGSDWKMLSELFPRNTLITVSRSPVTTQRSRTQEGRSVGVMVGAVLLLLLAVGCGIYAWHSSSILHNAEIAAIRAKTEEDARAALTRGAEDAKKKQELEAAKKALKELKKIASATSAGTLFNDYSRRVADAKVEVDSHLSDMPDDDLKASLQHIMETYSAAAEFWSLCIRHAGDTFDLSDSELQYYREYVNLDRGTGDMFLPVFWAAARDNINKTEASLQSQ